MTIAATLSHKLYETLGDEAAGAMVDWMQRVDTQRTELRELNDLSFARIDARFGEARAEMDLRFGEVHAKIDLRSAEVNGRIDALRAELGEKLATRYGDLLKWSFVFWATTMIALFLRTR
jgi:hypothetical protein